jgi:hypothetical protein
MKIIIINIIIIGILITMCESTIAASSLCTAQNKRTNQFFSATGKGDTQAAASQDAQNAVMQNCKQGSSEADGCAILGCSSSE